MDAAAILEIRSDISRPVVRNKTVEQYVLVTAGAGQVELTVADAAKGTRSEIILNEQEALAVADCIRGKVETMRGRRAEQALGKGDGNSEH